MRLMERIMGRRGSLDMADLLGGDGSNGVAAPSGYRRRESLSFQPLEFVEFENAAPLQPRDGGPYAGKFGAAAVDFEK